MRCSVTVKYCVAPAVAYIRTWIQDQVLQGLSREMQSATVTNMDRRVAQLEHI
jgi:hypothetical protein